MNTFILSPKNIPNLSIFDRDVRAIVPEFDGFLVEEDIVTVILTVECTQELIDQIEAIAPSQPTLLEIINKKRSEAQEFGIELSNSFINENIALGITQLGLTNKVRKALREIKDAIETGSVYDAITEIRALHPINDFDPYIITPERVLSFRNQIEIWLEVPLATTWDEPETWLG